MVGFRESLNFRAKRQKVIYYKKNQAIVVFYHLVTVNKIRFLQICL